MPAPPSDGAAKMPVAMAPQIPPTPCTPNTSSASSAPSIFFRPVTPHKHRAPATAPITIAPLIPTNPHAGVMATRPATAPDAAPSMEGLPLRKFSNNNHDRVATAVATRVLTKASEAVPLASRLEPTLKPNQPTHSRHAPTIVKVRLCGVIASLLKPIRLPTTKAATSPAIPALMCTTVPPAKSRAPLAHSQPAASVTVFSVASSLIASGPSQNHTMCAIGR